MDVCAAHSVWVARRFKVTGGGKPPSQQRQSLITARKNGGEAQSRATARPGLGYTKRKGDGVGLREYPASNKQHIF
jgi:hypothetical protein